MNRDEHIIVAGDLNDGRGQPTLRRIRGFDEVWPDLVQTGDKRYFDKADLGTRWTHEFLGIRNQIDHILISPSLADLTVRGGIRPQVVDHADAFISDHRPFILTLELR
jgi:endonuclease/exonuclease/phosphatase family metal-dependent hydrolase